MDEEAHRRQNSRSDHAIVFRPDHGHELLSDIGRDTHPGYPVEYVGFQNYESLCMLWNIRRTREARQYYQPLRI